MITEEDMEKLSRFTYGVSLLTMINIFGRSMGTHLWNKYKKVDEDLIKWWRSLDIGNRRKFIIYINSDRELKRRW